jgi:hypothetical protein
VWISNKGLYINYYYPIHLCYKTHFLRVFVLVRALASRKIYGAWIALQKQQVPMFGGPDKCAATNTCKFSVQGEHDMDKWFA